MLWLETRDKQLANFCKQLVAQVVQYIDGMMKGVCGSIEQTIKGGIYALRRRRYAQTLLQSSSHR